MTLFWSFLFVVSEHPTQGECIASAKCVCCIISIENENDMFRDCTNLNALHWNENWKGYCSAATRSIVEVMHAQSRRWACVKCTNTS